MHLPVDDIVEIHAKPLLFMESEQMLYHPEKPFLGRVFLSGNHIPGKEQHVLQHLSSQMLQHRLLGSKVVVKGAVGDSRAPGNIVDGGGIEPLFSEKLPGNPKKILAAPFFSILSRSGRMGIHGKTPPENLT